MTGNSRTGWLGGAIYVLAVLAFAIYVYAVDFDLIRFLWLGTALVGLAVPYVSYLASVPPILLGLADPVDGNALLPVLILLWTLAAISNVTLARLICGAGRTKAAGRVRS
ncbi:hypothetical protein ACQPYH_12600 [Kribbella sp. CA-245084]|uniref:hypothetical protein n=1 Tax=Kribbella sp. CA-245084 TaxID=3239940 RepID=UPI003D8A61F4